MKKMLLINLILSGLLMLIIFTSGKSTVVEDEERYTHHFEENMFGSLVLVPGSYRLYQPTGGYVVGKCPGDLYFNCKKIICDFPESGCGCAQK